MVMYRGVWNCLKSMDDTMKETYTPSISEEKWISHFQSLHSNEPLSEQQEAVIDELQNWKTILFNSQSETSKAR